MADIGGRFGQGGGGGILWMNTLSVRVIYVACILVWISLSLTVRQSGSRMNLNIMARDVSGFASGLGSSYTYDVDHVVCSVGMRADILNITRHRAASTQRPSSSDACRK